MFFLFHVEPVMVVSTTPHPWQLSWPDKSPTIHSSATNHDSDDEGIFANVAATGKRGSNSNLQVTYY